MTGLEKRGLGGFHGFLESQRAGNFESHVAGVHVVIFAVVQADAEIDHRETREVAARGGVANSLFDRGNPVLGDGAAKDVVDELDALAAFGRLHLDAADAELAVAAGLFFVLAFGIGAAANGFAIGDFGRLERQVHVIALVELGDDDFDVLLAGAGQAETPWSADRGRNAAQHLLPEFCEWIRQSCLHRRGF